MWSCFHDGIYVRVRIKRPRWVHLSVLSLFFFNKWRDSWDGRFNFLSLKIKGLWTPGNRKASCHKGGQPGICNRASPVHMNRRYLLWDCCHLVFPNSQILATMSRTQKITTNLQKVKVAQSCPTLHDSIDYTVHGILQARILEWVTIPFSRGSSQPRNRTQGSHIASRFFTSWAMREAQEYWSG